MQGWYTTTCIKETVNVVLIKGEGFQLRKLYELQNFHKSQFVCSVGYDVCPSSLHIEFHELYWRIFISSSFITTDPDLDVITCGGRERYIEPWW